MTRTMNYKLITLDENNHSEFTDIKCKDLQLNSNMDIKFMSMESMHKKAFLLISTKNYTKDIIIDETDNFNNGTVSIHYNKK